VVPKRRSGTRASLSDGTQFERGRNLSLLSYQQPLCSISVAFTAITLACRPSSEIPIWEGASRSQEDRGATRKTALLYFTRP
jgi:hypothetical protein